MVKFGSEIKSLKQKGVTILEGLVATAIVGIGFVAIFQMITYSVQSIDVSSQRTKANYLMHMVAEDIIGHKNSENSSSIKLKDQLVIVKQHIEREGIQCTAEIVKILKSEESLSNAVIKYAEKISADLIMIMTQQENEIKQLFIGSKAKEVIKNSEIPVLSIKPSTVDRIEIS